ncbi:E3 ubiquitin-protein ligase TRIM58-like [Lissotriton helveticus]
MSGELDVGCLLNDLGWEREQRDGTEVLQFSSVCGWLVQQRLHVSELPLLGKVGCGDRGVEDLGEFFADELIAEVEDILADFQNLQHASQAVEQRSPGSMNTELCHQHAVLFWVVTLQLQREEWSNAAEPSGKRAQYIDETELVTKDTPAWFPWIPEKKLCNNVTIQSPEAVKSYKVMVTLDPDTASPWLLLSEGGRRVRGTDTAQPLPDTPKRFTYIYWPCVVGSEGFTTGRHYWEVQLLQEGEAWRVGVAAESVNRKGSFTWSPEGGVWAVGCSRGQYKALTSPQTPLSPREKPRKLGVYLDYEGGRLSLYNADSMELLYSFPQAPFTQRLFPYFCLYRGAELMLV